MENYEDALYSKGLVPAMKALPMKKKRLKKIKLSQLLFVPELDEWQCLTVFVPLKVGERVGQEFDYL